MKLLASLILKTAAVLLTAWLLPGVELDGLIPAIWLVIVLVPIDYIVRPVLHILSLPISIITFGIFALFINGAMILLASVFVPNFSVDGLLPAILFSLILGFVTTILQRIFLPEKE
ncbi:MAG: phage holin family protein [Patescibacteria group bacterium]|nr:phage holin family protein [Patescibacteria group bacterium]